MVSAAESLLSTARSALADVTGLSGVFGAGPIQAVPPFATVEVPTESDWGHKTGAGRELRLVVTVRDEGEREDRVRMLAAATEAALLAMPAASANWRVTSIAVLRATTTRERSGRSPAGWAAVREMRVRMLAEPA